VHVPIAVLNRVDADGFDWQVPGFRQELAEAMVRTLPKARRRNLTPLSETAHEAAGRVGRLVAAPERTLAEALAAELSELAGEPIPAGALDVREVSPHLRITFSVEDGDSVVAVGKDLDAVRDLVGGRVRAAIAEATSDIERDGITRWDFGDLPRVVESFSDGHRVEGYPALLDGGDSVAIRVFSRPEVADRIMPGGVRRLVLLAVPVGVKGLEREIPNEVRLAVATVPELSMGKLLRDAIVASADAVLADHGGAVWDEASFEAVLESSRAELRWTTAATLRSAGEVLIAAAAVEVALEPLVAPALLASVDDARAHLRRLVRPGFVSASGTHRLADVARYVRGIERRLEKVPEDPVRDRQRTGKVLAVEGDYQKLLAALRPSQMTRRVADAGWMIEELRVSVFAQALGSKGQVSPKRITHELDRLFAGELD
jgi:ATP-dependent helicase HrpA